MSLESLINKDLKDDSIIDILELYDVRIIYDFDRFHENTDDIYWAEFKDNGFTLKFDKDQKLSTIFLYLQKTDDYKKFNGFDFNLPIYENFDEAEQKMKQNGWNIQKSLGEKGSEFYKMWIKAEYPDYFVHYQFKNNKKFMVTVMRKNA